MTKLYKFRCNGSIITEEFNSLNEALKFAIKYEYEFLGKV